MTRKGTSHPRKSGNEDVYREEGLASRPGPPADPASRSETRRERPENARGETAAETLLRLTAAINGAEGLEEVFEHAIRAITELLGVERASILLFDEEGVMRFRAWQGLSSDYRNAVEGHSPWTADEAAPRPVLVGDVLDDDSLSAYLPLFRAENIRGLAFVPLVYQSRLLGKFMLYDAEPRVFSEREVRLAEAVGGHIAQAATRIQLLEEERRTQLQLALRARQQMALADLGRRALEGPDLDDLFGEVVAAAVEVLEVEFGKVLELLPGGEELSLRAGVGWREGFVGETTLPTGLDSQAGHTLLASDLVIVEDLAAEKRFTATPLLDEHGVTSGMSAIIPGPEGPFGVLAIHSTRSRAFSPDDIQFLRSLTNVLGTAIGRHHADAALRDSEARLAGIVSSAMDAIVSVNEDQRIMLFNDAAERMFGTPATEAIGNSIDRFIPNRLRARHRQHIQTFGKTGSTGRRMGALGTLTALRSDGREFPIEATISQVTISGRKIYTVVVRDVTERRKAEEALEEANRRKDEFLALLGHELRNPLAPIVTALHLMRRKGGVRGEKELQVIERQVTHLTRLVDDLLDVSRITRGKLELEIRAHLIEPVVARAIEMAGPLLEKRAHRLMADVPADLHARIDPERLAQVLANLLTNAAKYTPPGGKIKVRAFRDGESVAIAVQDTGCGISSRSMPHLFDPFFQADRRVERGQGGLGLGLALVKNLVNLHGGAVDVRSDGPGQGSEFTVRIPRASRPEIHEHSWPEPAREELSTGAVRRVLVVDDIPDVADGLAELLRLHGHEVEVAHDGAQALELADRFDFDVALVDLGLPVMDGFELARHLREDGRHPGRLVAVTGYGQDADRARTLAAGFAEHLTKPVAPDLLLAVVEA